MGPGGTIEVARSGTGLLWPGVVTGAGVAGTLDEVVLHQLLHWHHFYDRSFAADMVSDGLFHLVSTALLVVGLYWAMTTIWRERDDGRPGSWRRFWAGLFIGLGGFNLYDGTVQHKVLRLHQVRMDTDNLLPYDLVFIGLAVASILVGVFLLRGSRGAVARGGVSG